MDAETTGNPSGVGAESPRRGLLFALRIASPSGRLPLLPGLQFHLQPAVLVPVEVVIGVDC